MGSPIKTEWKQTIRPENLGENHPVQLPSWTSQVALVVKNLPANAGNKRDAGLIPGLGRSLGEGNGTPLQYSCLENPMDRGVWWATVHGITKSQTRLKWLSTCMGHWNNRLVPNRKRRTSRLYIVTLLIQLICRVHHEKRWTGRNTSWNQDCREKYQ